MAWESKPKRILLRSFWIKTRSRILGGNFKFKKYGKTKSGSIIYKTSDNPPRFFTSFRQAIFYDQGARNRGISLGKSYALEKIKFSDGDVVVDCGANYGDLFLFFENKINYFAIEPGIDEFECLALNYKDNPSVRLFNYALGEKNEINPFYYSPEGANSSIIEPSGWESVYKVETQTLESFTKKHLESFIRIKLLKIEAEGFEPEIFYGARNILSKVDYISADLGFERGSRKSSTAPEVINFLLANGFEILEVGSIKSLRFLFKNVLLDSHQALFG